MKFKKGAKNTIIAYDLSNEEIYNLLKIQIKTRFNFVSDNEIISTLYLLDRTIVGNVQHINISTEEGGKKIQTVTYDTVVEMIKNLWNLGLPEIVFNSKVFNKKRPLIEIISDIKPDIINGCTYIDYNDGMFSVVNKPQNNKPNKLFYWEDTGSLFIFGTSGPILQYESNFDSIEQLICK